MNKAILFLVLAFGVMGCSHTPAHAPIPGSTSQFDSDTYQALATAHAFAVSVSQNVSTLSQQEKNVLNQFLTDLNAADMLYIGYHNGSVPQASMQTALTKVQTDQAAVVAQGGK
jgi:hypothetical protein